MKGEHGHDSRGRSTVASILLVLTCFVLGLLTGGMLVIGVSLVSFWKSLSPTDFQAWFASHSHLIGRLMIPLGVGGSAVAVAAVIACWRGSVMRRRWLLTAAVSTVAVMIPTLCSLRRPMRRSWEGAYRIQRCGPCSVNGWYGIGFVPDLGH
jgi:hypothetical protein